MVLNKVVNNNITTNIINSNIVEYNIKRAYPTILTNFNKKYDYLLTLTKDQYVNEIDKLFKEDKYLKNKIFDYTVALYNKFIVENKISEKNFLASTTDTLLIVDKIAPITKFDDIIEFKNKDKVNYTSLFYISPTSYILFDRVTKKIKTVGISNDPDVNSWVFVKKTLKDLCCILNEYSPENRYECMRKMKVSRINYLNNPDKNIYRSITNNNMFKYNMDGEIIYSEIQLTESENCVLMKDDNYMNVLLPLFRSFI